MPRQKTKPWPKVSASGKRAGTYRGPKPPKPPPNCAAAAPAIRMTSAAISPVRMLPARTRQRPVVLLDERLELGGHVVRTGERRGAGLALDLPAEPELEALQPLGHERLHPRQLAHVLIDAVVLELFQLRDHLVELVGVDALAAQHAAQIARVVGVLARLVAELTDVLGRQTAAVPPAAPRAVPAAGAAAVGAVEVAAEAAGPLTVATALATLLPFTLAVTLTLALLAALALTALALLTLALAFALLALTLLALAVLTLAVFALLALFAVARLLALL